ncbi:FHA domain-containing protein [Ilumatobacter sp.]|uniref:FHA domain-containing protein n=1 Tax=Ilumatobacter sp. TaxID=1967498 RepID=UPI003B51F471
MSDQVLNILKLGLLGLIYLFFARVLWAVWSEVRPTRVVVRDRSPIDQPRAVPTPQPTPARGARRRPQTSARAERLMVLEPAHRRGTTVALDREITLGRGAECTISIQDDAFVSTLHLRVYDYDGQPMVEDLGSTNGTFHNGGKLRGTKLLQPGDRIQVGTTVIEAQ